MISTTAQTDQWREMLREAGLRATSQRLAILLAISSADGAHLSADDVWERARAMGSDADRSTAFRSMTSLVSAGILRQVRFPDGVARFEFQQVPHHHGVCVDCGATVDIDVNAMRTLARQLMADSGFVMATSPQLISGRCQRCAAKTDADD